MDSREKFSEDFLLWIDQQCLLMFNASEKVNSIKDNLRWRHVHILIFISWKNKLFHKLYPKEHLIGWNFKCLLLWCISTSAIQFHVFSYPERTKRSHYLKKGQARSSIKIFNKAKIILIIINGNVDFTIKSRSARPVTAPLTRPPISPDGLTGCLWFPLNDGKNRFWPSTG